MKQEYSAAGGRPAFIEATPDGLRALNRYWPLVAGRVVGFARRVANCEADVDDMTAEAIETFWKLGPERYDLTDTEDLWYVTRILIHRMSKVWGGSSGKKQEEAEQAVRAMIGREALSQDDEQQIQVESHDLLDVALLNAEEFDDIISRREDMEDMAPGDDEREAA
jgi:DNA-directed RNA polymerase specialized sigma24 family protein